MGSRGRRSSADLSTKLAVISERRPAAPAGLTEAGAAVWRDVDRAPCLRIGSREPMPILTAYVRHVCRVELLAQQVSQFDPAWIKAEGGLERLNRLLAMAERESKAVVAVGRALRLTPSSQYGHRKAATINAAATERDPSWDD